MKLRRRFFLYLLALHALLGACGALLLWEVARPMILVVEGLILCSLLLFQHLVRTSTRPAEMIADGSRFINDHDFSHTFAPSPSLEVNQLVKLYNELIRRLRQERTRLQEQHYFLEKVLAVTPAGILTFSPDGELRYANPAARRLLQLEEREAPALPAILQDSWQELVEGDSEVVPLAGRRRIRVSRGSIQMEGFPCAVMILEDLTRELLRSEKAAWEKLIRTLSHEINNSLGSSQSLLRSCLGWADQLPEGEQEEFRQAIGIVLDRSRHLGQFMNSYAEVVRLPQPVLRDCEGIAMLEDLLALQRPELGAHGIRLESRIEVESWPLCADRPQLEQVLLNVLRNSMDALTGCPDPCITVSARVQGTVLRIECLDNGPGLSENARKQLFTPFFTTRPEGQGIGLTLVHEILGKHGFDFSLENREEGGAVFRVDLPGNRK